MIIAIHQPNYLPWIGFFDKLDQSDKFVLLDKAFFTKSEYIHRNNIKTPQGSHTLTVPVSNKDAPINEVRIAFDKSWKNQHWKVIESNYKKCPYWNKYKDGIEEIYNNKWEHLSTFNITIIKYLKRVLNISSELYVESEFGLDFGKGNARNSNIVSHLKGDIYLSGNGARVYNDVSEFEKKQIQLVYQNFTHPTYTQRWGSFIPNLSIIDMLFNCGPFTMEIIKSQRKE